MGLRFQRRVKLLPGVHLNLSLSGVGVSVGGRGAHIGVAARGQRYTSIGLIGVGLSRHGYHRGAVSPLGPSAATCSMILTPLALVDFGDGHQQNAGRASQ